jgi:hypothetical protein
MMRTSALLLTLLVAGAPAPVLAQGFGIKGGLSFGNVSNRGVLPGNLGRRTGFAAGVSLGGGPGLLGFGVEALYDQRGVKDDANPVDERKQDFLDVPAYLRVTLPTPGLQPFAYAGPQASFELRCHAGGVACPDTSSTGVARKKTEFAGIIGGGVRIGARGAFSLEGRYIYGLTDLKLNTVTGASSYKTRTFLILTGFSF